MTTFEQFCNRSKMRHDFDDQIQVRYTHSDAVHFDAWVSGAEALQRLESAAAEDQLRSLSRLSVDDLRTVVDSLPEAAKDLVRRSLRDKVADRMDLRIGGNPIGDALADAVRGRSSAKEPLQSQKERWLALLRYEPFRQIVLELAWIQLEGSFPDAGPEVEPDDWL